MFRLPFLFAFVVILAQAECVPGCDTNCSTTEQSDNRLLDNGATGHVVTKVDCSTCGHSTVRTTWTYEGAPDPAGSVTVALHYVCDNGQTGVYNVPRRALAPATELVYDDVGVRNVCGENARFGLVVEARNESGANIAVSSTVACPAFEGSGSPTAP